MIVSTVPGRIRIRARHLKSRRLLNKVIDEIQLIPGVHDARSNQGAGSITVNFDAAVIDAIELEEKIEAICLPRNKSSKTSPLSKQLNQATKIGMISTLAASIAYGAAGKKKPHIGYGVAFVGLAGVHMLKYANRLLRG